MPEQAVVAAEPGQAVIERRVWSAAVPVRSTALSGAMPNTT
jgi:hypothetical protein